MCGRFTLTKDVEEITGWMPELKSGPAVRAELHPRYNIAPSQSVAAVLNDGRHEISLLRWGLIPSWAKDPAIGNRLINARAESLAEKPSFRNSLRRRRCLVLADGFYEWQPQPAGRGKIPIYFRLKSGQPFAFAGLWDRWRAPEGDELATCTIITTTPNSMVAPVHDRMPVILRAGDYEQWLAPGEALPGELVACLQGYPAAEMESYAVARLVNNPAHEAPDCIQRVEG